MLAESVASDYVLMLENDCILIEPESQIASQLQLAVRRLVKGEVNVYRMRHRWNPGEKFDTIVKYRKYHLDKGEGFSFKKCFMRVLRPDKYKKLIGTAPYVHVELKGFLYDKYIQKQPEGA